MPSSTERWAVIISACYCEAQKEIAKRYGNKSDWLRASVVNIAQSGYFSSDRTIEQYANDIWHLKPSKHD